MFSEWLNSVTSNSSTTDSVAINSAVSAIDQSQQALAGLEDFQLVFSQALNIGITSELAGSLTDGVANTFSLEDISSSEGLAQLQASFLSSLQNDLFSSQSSTVADSTTLTSDDSGNVADSVSSAKGIFVQAYQFVMGDDGATLDDVFDTVNVLNHIPVVSDIYESVTDNHVDFAASLAGGFLYAGPVGVAYEGIDYFVSSSTGSSMTQHVKNYVLDNWFSSDEQETTELAESLVNTVEDGAHSFVTRNLD